VVVSEERPLRPQPTANGFFGGTLMSGVSAIPFISLEDSQYTPVNSNTYNEFHFNFMQLRLQTANWRTATRTRTHSERELILVLYQFLRCISFKVALAARLIACC